MPQTDLERLVFSMEANLNKLVKNMGDAEKTVENTAKHMEVRMKESESYMSKLFGKANVGEAIEKTFSRARFGILEEGGARVGVFGNALEALGPAGLAAAAGLFAAGEALEHAEKAAEYAEEIQNTADKLGITTKALQEFNFVALASGVSTEAMDEALQTGNERLGEFQSNIGSGRVKKVFEALGITPEEAAKAHTIVDLLPQIAEKMQGLSAAEQAAVAKRSGLEGIINVLRKGPEAIADLRAEAEKTGVVLDEDLIHKGKEAAEAMKEAGDAVDKNLKRAFIELAPILATALKVIAQIAAKIADISENIQGIQSYSAEHVKSATAQVDTASGVAGTAARFFGSRLDPSTGKMVGGGATGALGLNAYYNALQGQRSKLSAQGLYKSLADGIDDMLHSDTKPSPQLVADKAKKGPADQTSELDKTAKDEAENAAKELASAQAALTKNIQAHADFEKRAVDDETAKKLADLAAEEVKVRASKNDAHKAQQLALIAAARSDTQSAAAAKRELVDRLAEEASEKAYEEHQAAINQTMSAIADIMASMASTAAKRNAIERTNLLANQFRERQSFDEKTRVNQDEGVYDRPNGQADYERRMAERTQMLNLQAARRQQQTYQQAGPLQQYGRQLGTDVDQAGQKLMVTSLEQMNDALEKGFENWKNFGAAAKSAIRDVLGDMIKLSLEKAELAAAPGVSSLFSSAVSGVGGLFSGLWGGAHAGGGTIPAGKVGLVGEKGPELDVGGSSGSQIVPADITAGLLAGLGGASARPSVGQQNLTIQEHYHLAGAVSERDVMGMISRGRADTLNQAATMFKSGFGAQLASFSALQN